MRRRDYIRINAAVTKNLPLREKERRRCSTKLGSNILTWKWWDAKEEEAEAEAEVEVTVDRMDSIYDFIPSLTV